MLQARKTQQQLVKEEHDASPEDLLNTKNQWDLASVFDIIFTVFRSSLLHICELGIVSTNEFVQRSSLRRTANNIPSSRAWSWVYSKGALRGGASHQLNSTWLLFWHVSPGGVKRLPWLTLKKSEFKHCLELIGLILVHNQIHNKSTWKVLLKP